MVDRMWNLICNITKSSTLLFNHINDTKFNNGTSMPYFMNINAYDYGINVYRCVLLYVKLRINVISNNKKLSQLYTVAGAAEVLRICIDQLEHTGLRQKQIMHIKKKMLEACGVINHIL